MVLPGTMISMASSSDPYPPLEGKLRLSRACLEILKGQGLAVQVVTKSHLVVQDVQLLASMKACVAVTITTLDDSICRRLEPGAPLPAKRLLAISRLIDRRVPVSARIDPIIPGINDQEIEELVAAVGAAGAKHITSSTYKARPGNIKKIASVFPQEGAALERLFAGKDRSGGSFYLPAEVRRTLMERVKRNAHREGMTFSSCREGNIPDPGRNCDGSHLLSIAIN
jgi:DNA repair photolyase